MSFECDLCTKTFSSKGFYKLHLKKYHSKESLGAVRLDLYLIVSYVKTEFGNIIGGKFTARKFSSYCIFHSSIARFGK